MGWGSSFKKIGGSALSGIKSIGKELESGVTSIGKGVGTVISPITDIFDGVDGSSRTISNPNNSSSSKGGNASSSSEGGNANVNSAIDSNMSNQVDNTIVMDMEPLAQANLAQTELDKEMFMYEQNITEYELNKNEAKDKAKANFEAQKYKDEKEYKKMMLLIAGGGLAITLLKR